MAAPLLLVKQSKQEPELNKKCYIPSETDIIFIQKWVQQMHEHSQNSSKVLYYNVILWFVKKYSLKVKYIWNFQIWLTCVEGGADLVREPIMIHTHRFLGLCPLQGRCHGDHANDLQLSPVGSSDWPEQCLLWKSGVVDTPPGWGDLFSRALSD